MIDHLTTILVVLGFITATTKLTSSACEHTAKLFKASEERIERVTTYGYFVGAFISLTVILVYLL